MTPLPVSILDWPDVRCERCDVLAPVTEMRVVYVWDGLREIEGLAHVNRQTCKNARRP